MGNTFCLLGTSSGGFGSSIVWEKKIRSKIKKKSGILFGKARSGISLYYVVHELIEGFFFEFPGKAGGFLFYYGVELVAETGVCLESVHELGEFVVVADGEVAGIVFTEEPYDSIDVGGKRGSAIDDGFADDSGSSFAMGAEDHGMAGGYEAGGVVA